jgi:hypothetical protein
MSISSVSFATVTFDYTATLPFSPEAKFILGQTSLNPALFPVDSTGKAVCNWFRIWDVAYNNGGCWWGLTNPAQGVYDWSSLDAAVAACQKAGVKILYTFGWTPDWAAQTVSCDVKGNYSALSNRPPTITAYTAFVEALTARYAGKINAYEAWNEFNSLGDWCGQMSDLMAQQQVLYAAVKKADSTALVTLPTPCLNATTVDTEINALLAAGFQKYADIVSFHGYMNIGDPATAVGPTIKAVLDVMTANNCQLPLWDTECGPVWETPLTDAQAIAFIIQMIMTHTTHGVAALFHYGWFNTNIKEWGLQMVDSSGTVNAAGQAWIDVYNWFQS